jgi:hypothetical protein
MIGNDAYISPSFTKYKRALVSVYKVGKYENNTWFCQPPLRPHPLTPSPARRSGTFFLPLLSGEGRGEVPL